jgi:hypothetical protein
MSRHDEVLSLCITSTIQKALISALSAKEKVPRIIHVLAVARQEP